MKGVGRKAARVVAGQVVRQITAGGLQRLPAESELLKTYPVSRPTLREALRILEMYGVISPKPGPGGGAVVNQVAGDDFGASSSLYFHLLHLTVRDLLGTRLRLEPFMARLAAERVAAGEVDLTAETEELDVADVHFSVARLSADPILLLVAQALRDIFDNNAGMARSRADLGAELSPTHEDIAAAVRAGEAIEAERRMRAHLEDFVARLEKRDPTRLDEVIEWT